MAGGQELSFTSCQGGVVYEKIHLDGWRIDIYKFEGGPFLYVSERFTDRNLFKTGQTYDVTCTGMSDLHPVQSSMPEQRRGGPPLTPAIFVNAHDGIPNLPPSADDSAKRQPSQVIRKGQTG